MRKLDHCNIVRLRYFFYSSGEKVRGARRRKSGWLRCQARGEYDVFLLRHMKGAHARLMLDLGVGNHQI